MSRYRYDTSNTAYTSIRCVATPVINSIHIWFCLRFRTFSFPKDFFENKNGAGRLCARPNLDLDLDRTLAIRWNPCSRKLYLIISEAEPILKKDAHKRTRTSNRAPSTREIEKRWRESESESARELGFGFLSMVEWKRLLFGPFRLINNISRSTKLNAIKLWII